MLRSSPENTAMTPELKVIVSYAIPTVIYIRGFSVDTVGVETGGKRRR
jgi:hypothetical protein